MKAILVGNANPKLDNISAAQLFPFFDNRKCLERKLNLKFRHLQAVTLPEIAAVCYGEDADAFFIRPCWREEPTAVIAFVQELRANYPNRKIIFIDPFDQETSRFFGVLPSVDWFLKYQGLKDINEYKQHHVGGTIITDYLARELHIELDGWHVGSEVPDGYEKRIISGWNVGIDKRFKKQLIKAPIWRLVPKKKDIDVFCRVSLGSIHKQEWYIKHRIMGLKALKPLEAEYKLAVSGEFDENKTISSRQYFSEIKRSRIAFSPFGWGPTTWRDYEAVCYDCLLVKPLMDRIDAKPNIYVADETYIPLKWDFSDAAEKCNYYLQHWNEAEVIIRNARSAYENYFRQEEFVKTIQDVLA